MTAPPEASGSLRRDGFDLRYRVYGKAGERVVLLAGGPGADPDYLAPVVAELRRDFRCVLLEQRGTGRSVLARYDTGSIHFAAYLEDLEALRRHLGLERLLLVGHSWGMMLALAYAGRYPDRVAAVVTLGSGPIADEHAEAEQANLRRRLSTREWGEIESWAKRVGDDPRDAVYEIVRVAAPGYFFDRGTAAAFLRGVAPDQLNSAVILLAFDAAVFGRPDEFVRARLPAVRAPVLLVHGRQDAIPEGCTAEAHALVAGSTLALVNECGHLPWLEQPGPTWRALHDFLRPWRGTRSP